MLFGWALKLKCITMFHFSWSADSVVNCGDKYSKVYVDKKNQLDVTFCILYFSSNSCSTCFGQPRTHHQELMTA